VLSQSQKGLNKESFAAGGKCEWKNCAAGRSGIFAGHKKSPQANCGLCWKNKSLVWGRLLREQPSDQRQP
jgi:hypothetical protein